MWRWSLRSFHSPNYSLCYCDSDDTIFHRKEQRLVSMKTFCQRKGKAKLLIIRSCSFCCFYFTYWIERNSFPCRPYIRKKRKTNWDNYLYHSSIHCMPVLPWLQYKIWLNPGKICKGWTCFPILRPSSTYRN